jgi:hypothetical protein
MISIIEAMKELPEGYEEACYSEKAIQRNRGISNANNLMMLNMFHLMNGTSLIEISSVARLTKLGEVSDVAYMKRFEKCNGWFKWINERLVNNGIIEYKKPEWLERYRVLTNDASDVTEKGRSGRLYRLHYALELFTMQTAQQIITDQEKGEALTNFSFQRDDLVVGDRIYSTFKGIRHCLECEANFVLRLRANSFNLYDSDSKRIDLLEKLRETGEEGIANISVFVKLSKGSMTALRICAKRKPASYSERNKQKLQRRESKHQVEISDEAKEFNNYIVVVTALPDEIAAEEILELYRARWQVELYFKRLKSIMDFGELPKKRTNSSLAWLNGKIMIALLIEKFISRQMFSPEGKSAKEYLA